MKSKNLFVLMLIFTIVQSVKTARAQSQALTVHLHLNGYEGNLYYFSGPDLKTQTWFYGDKDSNPTINLQLTADNTYDIFNGSDYLGFKIDHDKVVLGFGNPKAITLKQLKPFEIDVTFNTSRVTIKKKCLTMPFMFTAFALIPGQTNTKQGYRVINHDTTVTLIRAMDYKINGQAYIYLKRCLFTSQMRCNPGFQAYELISNNVNPPDCNGDERYPDDFAFNVDSVGMVNSKNLVAAKSSGHTLIFNTVKVYTDRNCISNGNPLRLSTSYSTNIIIHKKSIKVIAGVLNHMFWIENNARHDYYSISNPIIKN